MDKDWDWESLPVSIHLIILILIQSQSVLFSLSVSTCPTFSLDLSLSVCLCLSLSVSTCLVWRHPFVFQKAVFCMALLLFFRRHFVLSLHLSDKSVIEVMCKFLNVKPCQAISHFLSLPLESDQCEFVYLASVINKPAHLQFCRYKGL
jgi:hypothetical protein